MGDRINIPLDLEKKIVTLTNSFKASTKAAVIRLGIGVSLSDPEDPRGYNYDLAKQRGVNGYQKSTIFADNYELYELMVKQHLNFDVNDKDIENVIKMHIARGIEIIHSDYELLGSGEKVKDKYFKLLVEGV